MYNASLKQVAEISSFSAPTSSQTPSAPTSTPNFLTRIRFGGEEGFKGTGTAQLEYIQAGRGVNSKVLAKTYISGAAGSFAYQIHTAKQIGNRSFSLSSPSQTLIVLRDHQGSTVAHANLNAPAGQMISSTDHWTFGPLGIPQHFIVSDDPTQPPALYTGKEYNDSLMAYNYGARYFDPTLGVWLTPDPANQFFNPYAYGGDGVNFVDPDGRRAIYINGIGGADNEDFNPIDWDYSETWDEILIGGAIGAAAGGTGAWVGAATGYATLGLAAGSTTASALGNADDLARGRDPRGLSTNLGAFDINWGANDWFNWNNPYDEGDRWYNPFRRGNVIEDFGDIMGWTTNTLDVYQIAGGTFQNKGKFDESLDEGFEQNYTEKGETPGSGNFHGGKLGPNNKIGPYASDGDFYSHLHDMAYTHGGAAGPGGVVFNASTNIIKADLLLGARSLVATLRGANQIVNQPVTFGSAFWTAGAGVVFTGVSAVKASLWAAYQVSNGWYMHAGAVENAY